MPTPDRFHATRSRTLDRPGPSQIRPAVAPPCGTGSDGVVTALPCPNPAIVAGAAAVAARIVGFDRRGRAGSRVPVPSSNGPARHTGGRC